MDLAGVAVALIAFFAGLAFVIAIQPLIRDYRVGPRGVEFLVLRFWVVWTLRFENIAEAERIRAEDALAPRLWFAWRLGNRLRRVGVLVRRRRGLFRSLLLTPQDPDAFVAGIKRGMAAN